MDHRSPLPPHVWRWLGLTAVLLTVATVAAIGFISAGVFDPQPVGDLAGRQQLDPVAVPAGETRVVWLEEPLPEAGFTVRLTAHLAEGERDAGYGLLLGAEDRFLAVAVSPLGYIALWEQRPDGQEMLLPWQTWPHVHLQEGANEIWVDVQAESAAVRVNRELLWEGQWTPAGSRVGLLAQSFGDAAVVDFQELIRFTAAP